jgi:hypothetical protein
MHRFYSKYLESPENIWRAPEPWPRDPGLPPEKDVSKLIKAKIREFHKKDELFYPERDSNHK